MPGQFFVINNILVTIPPKLDNFHAWSGNKGVRFVLFTVLMSILTPGMEIKGSK